ncbi:MAG TPA: Rieske (2Fe-2S) protein [Solirubrobacteraceae bacterium]|jgi:nitrite reductase/ring-hydroxylating ferredoxin subunit|nr:Rieske (2Fe-2S) protein [Solirubrobacteraceae bacterium]
MGEHLVGRLDDIPEEHGLIVEISRRQVGLFRRAEEVFALQAVCPHQAGPVGRGGVFPLGRAEVRDGRLREWLDPESLVVACPWHGWEFDLRTGTCVGDPCRALRRYESRVKDGEVFVTLDGGADAAADA